MRATCEGHGGSRADVGVPEQTDLWDGRVLTIRWLMTAVRALWSPLKQCKLRARHSKRAWLHICRSLGPNDSSERGEGSRNVRPGQKIKVVLAHPGSGRRTGAAQDVRGEELQLLPEEGHVGLSDVDTLQDRD